MTDSPVLAATAWASNAHLIEACAQLGYLRDADHVLDPTYGNGVWWKRWRPSRFTTHSRDRDGSDFTQLVYPDESFDAIAFDPPYVAKGGRATSGIKEMDARYGQDDAPPTPRDLQTLINAGLTEMRRLVKPCGRMTMHESEPNGVVLVKCQDYVSSGRLWPGTHYTLRHALRLGFMLHDRLEHISGVRPQPPGRRQCHARRNLSTLLVLRRLM